jgi:hypothetical protein
VKKSISPFAQLVMQLNTELPPDTLQAQAPQRNAALIRPPYDPEPLDIISVILLWVLLFLSWAMYLALRLVNTPEPDNTPKHESLSVPITPCEIQKRRQRN